MRILLLISILVSTTSILAGPKDGRLFLTANTEQEVLSKVEDMVPNISYASVKEVIRFGHKHKCIFRIRYPNRSYRIKFTSAEIDKMFKLKSGKMVSYYRALVRFRFGDCRG